MSHAHRREGRTSKHCLQEGWDLRYEDGGGRASGPFPTRGSHESGIEEAEPTDPTGCLGTVPSP